MLVPKLKGFFYLSVLLLFTTAPILAKTFDATNEKPDELPKPDEHRIFLRGNIGSGSLQIPQVDAQTAQAMTYTLFSVAARNPSLYINTLERRDTATSLQSELEYRYKDKFRVFYENRDLTSNTSYKMLLSKPIQADWNEKQSRLGIGYFHPILEKLNLGVSLRRVNIEQSFQIPTYFSFSYSFTPPVGTYLIAEGSKESSSFKGIVPGVHLEYKPLRWFEIHYKHLLYNLKGNGNGLDYAGATGGGATGLLISTGDQTYKGYSHTLDFVFRYSAWFATRWGYTQERFVRNDTSYIQMQTGVNPIASLAYSAVYQGLSASQVNLNSINLTLEFSEAF